MAVRNLAVIGCGAIGSSVIELLRDDAEVRVTQVIVPASNLAQARALCARVAPQARVLERVDLANGARPDLLVECAGHDAVGDHVLPALRAGVASVVVSIGALHDADAMLALEAAATDGGTHVSLVSGAIGGIDALAAARIGGLDSVIYTGRKPALSWRGTPAERDFNLAALTEPTVIFTGSAREAARLYPKNANVAATVSLAGLGLDRTRATLIADPRAQRTVHRIEAVGTFGRLDLTLEGQPLPANPKTSALTVYSVVRAIHNVSHTVSL
jgi:aspartate dehydrogenase